MYDTFLDRQAQALHRAEGYWVERHRVRDQAQPRTDEVQVVALSRDPGTPDAEIARAVGERLNWAVYDDELRARLAASLRLPVAQLESIDERRPSWLEECMKGFALLPGVSDGQYLHHLVALIHTLGVKGRCVIVGRGAGHILPHHSTLRVHLVGDREDRLARLMRRFRIRRHEAERRLEETTREQARFLREYFAAEPANPGNHDLVLNASHWSIAECTDLIVAALHRKSAGCPAG